MFVPTANRSPACFNSRTPCGVRPGTKTGSIDPFRFNSRTPCGVRPPQPYDVEDRDLVSIHAPHVGCDDRKSQIIRANNKFQFTHPVWGATKRSSWMFRNTVVSIHAPRVGRDRDSLARGSRSGSFNSRSPYGARSLRVTAHSTNVLFQFTHPMWGATERLLRVGGKYVFQFTHPMWGAT